MPTSDNCLNMRSIKVTPLTLTIHFVLSFASSFRRRPMPAANITACRYVKLSQNQFAKTLLFHLTSYSSIPYEDKTELKINFK